MTTPHEELRERVARALFHNSCSGRGMDTLELADKEDPSRAQIYRNDAETAIHIILSEAKRIAREAIRDDRDWPDHGRYGQGQRILSALSSLEAAP